MRRWVAPAACAPSERAHGLQSASCPSQPWCLPAFACVSFSFFTHGMSSEGDTIGGCWAVVTSAEEAPFSAVQLAWIDRLIATPRLGLWIAPLSWCPVQPMVLCSSVLVFVPRRAPLLLLAIGCNQLLGPGTHGPPPPPLLLDVPGIGMPWIMAPSGGGARGWHGGI